MESYLDRFPIGCQHFLRKLHHLQGHVRNWFGMTFDLLVKSPCHTVRVPYRLNLYQRQRRGQRLVSSLASQGQSRAAWNYHVATWIARVSQQRLWTKKGNIWTRRCYWDKQKLAKIRFKSAIDSRHNYPTLFLLRLGVPHTEEGKTGN